jgi:hypothetical protein
MISSLSLLDRKQKEHPFPRLAAVVGSTPSPSPFLSVVQLRYYFEFILSNCRTNLAAIPLVKLIQRSF